MPEPTDLPPPSAGEGGPRVSEGRERGTQVPEKARPSCKAQPDPEAGVPSPPLLRRVPSSAEGGGRAWRGLALAAVPFAASAALWLAWPAPLPPLDLAPANLRSTIVTDRAGQLLRPFATADGRWRLPVAAAGVDPRFLAMLTAYEDRRFADHAGVDPAALARAGWQWLRHGRIVSGGSTLAMQVARLVEPRPERSLSAKLRQIRRARELESSLGKAGVLDAYLALAPYGGPVEGVRAAALAYLGREPARLSTAEAALLVALPQAPEARRPDRHPERARRARDRVLDIAAARGVITPAEARTAKTEPVPSERRPFPMRAAHAAEAAVAADPASPIVRLSLDGRLQASLEALAAERAAAAGPGLSAAILVLDNRTGAVLAQVGSPGYLDASRRGAIDMTLAVRSPGSALKPFIYALAFENGLAHPETLLEDRPARFAATYAPENFDLTYQGTVTARRALQLSLNVPAVELLEAVGPARFIARLRAGGAGIILPREAAPGLPVALGGLGITLTDLARLYAGLARGGSVPEVVRRAGAAAPESERRIAEPVAAWYVADTLRGAPPPENALPNRIAYKTGTSFGYRDAWAVGFDRRITVAVWLGRADGAAVPGLVGRGVAAPVLFDAFSRFGGEPEPVARPPGTLSATSAALPPPLRHLRADIPRAPGQATAPLRIAYPPDGSRVDVGHGEGAPAGLALKALGGVPPLTWMVNSLPVDVSARRQSAWVPDGSGFVRISVIDAAGGSDSVVVRVE
ncbi:penicillin-binding protein 1C [Methylobacterium radiodurans]|uniref:peptidoglycan glycosyltransferase n=1 Tax=Methylobacterium radiodurans TaxID=2202828 RepID=A0A2U8VNR1_9HYPH|nr:penicillin-binding protein 1C [Methylobacterium radiodurans]AWN35329.1 penicillin-binding protein 1C [Methylobacterium radiodurans]